MVNNNSHATDVTERSWQLRCPHGDGRLQPATPAQLAAINQLIGRGGAFSHAGQLVREPVTSALQSSGGLWAYPIVQGVPQLLTSMAIDTSALRPDEPGADKPCGDSAQTSPGTES